MTTRPQTRTTRTPSVGSTQQPDATRSIGSAHRRMVDRSIRGTRAGAAQQRDSLVERLVKKRQSASTARRESASTVRSGTSVPSESREGVTSQRSGAGRSGRGSQADRMSVESPRVAVPDRSTRGGIDRIRAATRDRIGERKTNAIVRARGGAVDRTERVRVAGSEVQARPTLMPRLRDYARHSGTRVVRQDGQRPHRDYARRRPHVVYHDRPDLVRHSPRHVHTYRDRHHRLSHRIIWPRYHYPVYYRWGPYWSHRWVHPYYHRKYVFVSLGGWWPWDYTYARYYWYGWHPYTWYGYYPIPRQVDTGTYNYYTYNYYTQDEGAAADSTVLPYGIDAETLAKVQERIAQQEAVEPAAQTQADLRFEEGVTSFEAGRYAEAAGAFSAAMALSPEDAILPFAYAQSLFADKQYSEAAEVLRSALLKVTPEEQGVFYPRGLYANDDALFEQIEQLLDKVETYGFDADLKLLLGYHLLGVGETEYARAPLEQAGQDLKNVQAATVLLDLLKKMEATDSETADQSPQTRSSSVQGAATAPGADATEGAAKADVLKRMEASPVGAGLTTEPKTGTESGTVEAKVKVPGAEVDSPPAKKEDDDS